MDMPHTTTQSRMKLAKAPECCVRVAVAVSKHCGGGPTSVIARKCHAVKSDVGLEADASGRTFVPRKDHVQSLFRGQIHQKGHAGLRSDPLPHYVFLQRYLPQVPMQIHFFEDKCVGIRSTV